MNDLIKKYLPKAAPGQTLLDLGCGDGSDAAFAAASGYVVHAKDKDNKVTAFNADIPNISFETADIRNMTLNASYDYICLMNVLIFLTKKEASDLLRSLTKFLKKKGTLIISVFSDADPSYKPEMGYFTPEELKLLLPEFIFLHATEKTIVDEHGGRRHVHAITEVVAHL